MPNDKLRNARINKNDEFYTELKDIQKELWYYDFTDKIVYSPCDDYRVSNFTKYFTDNFKSLGLKKYICTNVDTGNGAWRYEYDGTNTTITKLLDGDFSVQSETCDVICTNPPFSLLRKFIGWCGSREILLIIPKSALAYNEIFPLIQEGKAWIGLSSPDSFGGTDKEMKGLTYWLTNIHKPVPTSLNLTKTYNPTDYPTYDTYPAIEVGRVKDIPLDYTGEMGVPITYLLGNYEGYEIKGILKGEFSKTDKYTLGHRPELDGKALYTRVIIKKL